MEKKESQQVIGLKKMCSDYNEQIKRDLKINPGDLKNELFQHPSIAYTWHVRGAEVKKALDSLELTKDLREASLRSQFILDNPKCPATSLKLKSTIFVQMDDSMIELQEQIVHVAKIWGILEGARWRFAERFKAILNERGKELEEDSQIYRMQKEMENS